ncbi:TlpA family protein disulfide reductase [Haladaptatus sp. NG-SE-30]
MDRYTRRAFLRIGTQGASVLGVGVLAGCLGSQSGTSELETLSVAGSPGGSVRVRPPEKTVLLDFFATWCAPCGPQMKHLRAVRERFDSKSFYLLSITSETDREAVRSFWKEYDATWPVAIDPDLEAATQYDAKRLPTLLLLAPDGTEHWRHVGLAATDTIVSEIEAVRG